MSEPTHVNELLDTLARVLLRCFVLGILLLLFWFGFFMLAGDWAHGIHAKWFDLTKHDFRLVNYYGMASLKIGVFLFFLLPYIAIRMVLAFPKSCC